MRNLKYMFVGALALGLLATPARADSYKDEKLGFQMSFPQKWTQLPMAARSDSWVVARFQSNREYEGSDVKTNNYAWLKPSIDVVVIPKVESDGATVVKTDKGIKILRDLPWKNMREYLDQTSRGIGGFHFSKEEEGVVNGMKCEQFELTVDKMVTGERRVYGWAYHTDDAIYGLVCHIFAQHERKLKPLIFSSFKSFKTFARTGSLPNTGRTGEEINVRDIEKERDSLEELSDEDLKKRRDDAFDRALARGTENLPKGWWTQKSKNFVAVSHVDKRYTAGLLKHAEAFKAWLDRHLGFVGNGYTGKIILRICADSDEHSAYLNSRGWFSQNPEVVTYKDRDGWSDWAMESLNRTLFDVWLRDKNDRLRNESPSWISYGLSNFLEGAHSKGNKIVFRADTWEIIEMKKLHRDKALRSPREFFSMTSREIFEGGNYTQAQFFVKFLLVGNATRSKKYKSIFQDYVKNLIFHIDTADDEEAEVTEFKAPQNEEEEAAMFRNRANRWEEKERETLDALLEKTFPDWDDKDWSKFEWLYLQGVN